MNDAASPLADAKSPFLRHGADQPVDWLPWGEEAFRRASELNRPILMDIGAVWCHWCHVMDRESYDDPDTAAIINEHFVAVKVDRDERPDVDSRYQRAVQSLTGQGGWPLTVFMTAEGDAFHGGTYFPPEDAHGRPAFRRVLREIARVWREDRTRVRDAVHAVRDRLGRALTAESAPGDLEVGLLDRAVDAFAQSYDATYGGFGNAPKFPSPGGLGFLLDRWLDTGSELARNMVEGTLQAIVRGGIHDQIGGGFHRYSVDARWIVPHFEKMAYDNGPLLGVLARTSGVLDRPDLASAASRTVAHYRDIAADLVDAGGFPASQDADIGFEDDGDYWTWTEAEVRAALEEDDSAGEAEDDAAETAILRWGLQERASAMHLDPERHVLFQAMDIADIARRLDRPEDAVAATVERARRRLKDVRDERAAPYVDRTLYSGWVALVSSGHLAAARHLGLTGAGADALRALDRIWDEAWLDGRGLLHRLGDPESGVMLGDQAHGARALLDAFEWTQDAAWLDRARALTAVIRDRFGHRSGGLRDLPTGDDGISVLANDRLEITDAPEPSPTAVAAECMARIAALDHDDGLADAARRVLEAYAGFAVRFGTSAPTYLRAVRWIVAPVTTVVVVEEDDGRDGARGGPLTAAALETYRPATVVRWLDPVRAGDAPLPDAVRAMLTGDAPRAYVCAGTVCAEPVSVPGTLRTTLRTFRG